MRYTKLDKIRILDRTRRCLLATSKEFAAKGDRKGEKETTKALVALAYLLKTVLDS